MATIKILGTAGARYVVAKQLRSSAGTYIEYEGTRLVLDPGPGTLVRMATTKPRLDVMKLHGLILTHAHLDHSNDVNILIDGLTEGGLKKRGVLFAPRECLSGNSAVVLKYLRPYLKEIKILEAEKLYTIGNIKFRTSRRHYHTAETYGIIFDFSGKKVGFLVDTLFSPRLIESYRDCQILIINVVRFKPHPSPNVQHLCVRDVEEILAEIRPEKAILTHFGMTMLKAQPHQIAAKLSRKLNLEVIAAYDGLTLEI
ncbi:metallo-beta-lactamase family protein [Thermodesulfatator indicus DSM 15286]|uniref:Metallo-beta-lactamase family protein n=1 Tax=Thermodesulfatator indicus (strain DSM 15286 / JCM 11887 / CIR29812) TaxID=667014 RepID=F8AD86_THEID|nr:MBL fold metallo-hydrolase [Thermodesulfatator indicus]AEH44820.1 metallo-beta-lactamase family protein [Thermodesulfatator indicus DSM 15286]